MAYTTLVSGTTITASWANASVRDQVVSPFTDSAARASAITSPVAGMITTLTTTNRVDTYNGTAWCGLVNPSDGALPTWTPVVQQSSGVAVTINLAVYQQVGRRWWCQFHVAATAAGTANNAILIGGLPVTAAGSGLGVVNLGVGAVVDVSAGNMVIPLHFNLESSTTLSLYDVATPGTTTPRIGLTAQSNSLTLASGDTISGTFELVSTTDA